MKTNADKYLKEGVDICDLAREIWCNYRKENNNLVGDIIVFFNKSIQPTLTEDEKVILRNIDKEANYIGRHNNSIFINEGKLYVSIGAEAQCWKSLPCNHLFQFIKKRRRI